MFIALTEPFGQWAKGDIIEVKDAVGRSYIESGMATESSESAHLRAQFQAEIARIQAESRAQFQELVNSIKASTASEGPPSRGIEFDDKGVPINKAEDVKHSEASEDRGTKCFGDILRCIWMSSHPLQNPANKQWAATRLQRSYGLEQTQFETDSKEVSRGSPGAVNRAGTESMGGGVNYGYLLKPQFYGSLFEIAMEESIIEPNAFNVPIGDSLELRWPTLDQYLTPASGQSASYAGVYVGRKGENSQRPYSDGKLRELTFKVTDLTGFTPLSRDLIADNYIAADAVIQRLFARAMAWKKDQEFFAGNGVGKPLGILNSPALLSQTRAVASHIRLEDLQGMISIMHQSCWQNAMWVAHQTCYTDLGSIISSSPSGFAYQPNALFGQWMKQTAMANTISNTGDKMYKGAGQLLGFPLRYTEKIPALGTTGCLLLIDPSQYGVATRQGLEVGISEHFLFDTDQVAFRFKIRNDGQPMWQAPYIDAHSTTTKYSPFIQLTQ